MLKEKRAVISVQTLKLVSFAMCLPYCFSRLRLIWIVQDLSIMRPGKLSSPPWYQKVYCFLLNFLFLSLISFFFRLVFFFFFSCSFSVWFFFALLTGRAEWLDKGHRKCLILWHRIQEWADIIVNFVSKI